jgi:glyoxylase-like metal-dependent hydrolase (beta-lactamase superfamily II)
VTGRSALHEIRIDPVLDCRVRTKPNSLFPEPIGRWDSHRDLMDAEGRVELALGGFLLRWPNERIALVDLGVGPDSPNFPPERQFLEVLRAFGVSPEDVTEILLTHLHIDHVGWASVSGNVTFPNATYRFHEADWEHFRLEDRIAAKLEPVLNQSEVFRDECAILPGVDLIESPGHTPGSSCFRVSSSDGEVLILGDVVHCPVQLLESEWSAIADVDPGLARKTRARLVRELEGSRTKVAGCHFPGLRAGRLLNVEGVRTWQAAKPEPRPL